MGPKMDSLLYAFFGLPPAQQLRLALVDPDRQILEGVEARSVMPAVCSTTRALPLLLPPSPSSNGRLLLPHGETKSQD